MPTADDLKQSMSAKLVQMADNHYQLGQLDKAIDYYRQAMAIARESAEPAVQRRILVNLALSVLRLGEFDHAREYYDQALHLGHLAADLQDAQTESNEILLLIQLGKIYYQQGNLEKAGLHLETAATRALDFRSVDDRAGARLQHLAHACLGFVRVSNPAAESQENRQSALTYGESTNDEQIVGTALIGIGLTEALIEHPAKSVNSLKEAVAKLHTTRDQMLDVEARACLCLSLVETDQSENAVYIAHEILDQEHANLSERARCVVLTALGLAQSMTGEASASIDTLHESMALSRDILNRGDGVGLWMLGRSFVGVGNAHEESGNIKEALAAYLEALNLPQEIKETSIHLKALLGAGAMRLQSNPEQARQQFDLARSAAQASSNRIAEALALAGLAQAEAALGNLNEAYPLLEHALVTAEETGDQPTRCLIYVASSTIYRNAGKSNKAIKYAELALELARANHIKRLESQALGSLGLALTVAGDAGKAVQAVEYLLEALELAKVTGDYRRQTYLGGLGAAYAAIGEAQKAVDLYSQALAEARENDDRSGEVIWLANLANLYAYLGHTKRAIERYQQAIKISEELGDQAAQASTLVGLGLAYSELDQLHNAVTALKSARALFRELGDQKSLAQTDELLAQIEA